MNPLPSRIILITLLVAITLASLFTAVTPAKTVVVPPEAANQSNAQVWWDVFFGPQPAPQIIDSSPANH